MLTRSFLYPLLLWGLIVRAVGRERPRLPSHPSTWATHSNSYCRSASHQPMHNPSLSSSFPRISLTDQCVSLSVCACLCLCVSLHVKGPPTVRVVPTRVDRHGKRHYRPSQPHPNPPLCQRAMHCCSSLLCGLGIKRGRSGSKSHVGFMVRRGLRRQGGLRYGWGAVAHVEMQWLKGGGSVCFVLWMCVGAGGE
jgi:hypothetical protein